MFSGLSRFSYSDLEGTSWDVAAVELDVDGVDAVFPRDEPDGVLVWTARRRETVSSERQTRKRFSLKLVKEWSYRNKIMNKLKDMDMCCLQI